MPKIIEDLENKLILEARRQIEQNGYGAVTIRSIAKGCSVGVGTVYNYFSSKDELLAAYMLSDWKQCIAAIESSGADSAEPEPVLRCIYDQLSAFSRRHSAVFQDASAAAAFAGSVSRYHALLRSQLAAPLRKFCDSDFTAEFAAEALLTWTVNGTDFRQFAGLLGKLF